MSGVAGDDPSRDTAGAAGAAALARRVAAVLRRGAGDRSSFARIAGVIVLGFAGLHLASSLYWGHERMLAGVRTLVVALADRALLLEALERDQPALAVRLAGPLFDAGWIGPGGPAAPGGSAGAAVLPDGFRAWPHADEVGAALRAHLHAAGHPRAAAARVHVGTVRAARPDRGADAGRGHRVALVVLDLPRADGGWLRLRVSQDADLLGWHWFAQAWSTLWMLVVLAAVLLATRRALRWFDRFAQAADQVGQAGHVNGGGPEVPGAFDESAGPREVRRAAASFNRMRQRIAAHGAERTALLAAVSHDLRTLATRLGLRLAALSDGGPAPGAPLEGARRDIADMVQILDETLAFVREEGSTEPAVALDLGALVMAVVDDHADLGQLATVDAAPGIVVRGQPLALRRAFGNLVDNALRYGGAAQVEVVAARDRLQAIVRVRDPGPGIPPADRARALLPFVRLDASRNRASGGTGLGLAIVRTVIDRHGGTLEFRGGADVASAASAASAVSSAQGAGSGEGGSLDAAAAVGFVVTVTLPAVPGSRA